MNSNVRTAVLWVVLICVAVILYVVVKTGRAPAELQLTFTQFIDKVEQGQVKSVAISGTEVKGVYNNGDHFKTTTPSTYTDYYKTLREKGVSLEIHEASSGNWISILINAVPFVLLLAFWIFMMRQMQSGGNKDLSFGKSRARLHPPQQKKETFKDKARG